MLSGVFAPKAAQPVPNLANHAAFLMAVAIPLNLEIGTLLFHLGI